MDETLAGREGELKEYTIGVHVFQRGARFDPRIDPIVRVQVSKLRQRLATYYKEDGAPDGTRIEIEAGSYVPRFVPADGKLTGAAGVAARNTTVAVMPLLDLTGERGNDHLSTGLMDELISVLGRLPGLHVIGRTSAIALAAQKADLREIGARLGAGFVLEGSLRKRGETLRVTVRLTGSETGHQLWTRRFEGQLESFPQFEEWVARRVGETILSSVDDVESAPAPRRASTESFNLVLQAWHQWRSGVAEDWRTARGLFQAAIREDPANYLAQAGFATLCALMGNFALMPAEEALRLARPAMSEALRLAPHASEPWEACGAVESMLEWRFEEGAASYRKALERNPSNILARHGLAINCSLPLGRMDEAIAGMRRAVALDPLSWIEVADLGVALSYAGRYDEAIETFQRAREFEPGADEHSYYLAHPMLMAGKADEALRVFGEHPPGPPEPYAVAFYALALAMAGHREAAESKLEEFRQTCPNGEFATEVAPMVLLELGRREEALTVLEQLVERRDPQLRYLAVDPYLKRLRGEPRFEAVLQQIGLI